MNTNEYSLRQKKHAKTKIAIMEAFIKRLEKTSFEDISIRQICKSIDISEGTFFNYFSEKIDILTYYSALLFIKIFWKTQKEVPSGKNLALIEAFFKNSAAELDNVNIVYQMISVMVMQRHKPKQATISAIEKHLVFPEYEGIENIPVFFIDDFFTNCLKAAVKNGELPKKTNIDDVRISLVTILTGTLLATKFTNSKDQAYHYSRQLDCLWKSLGVKTE